MSITIEQRVDLVVHEVRNLGQSMSAFEYAEFVWEVECAVMEEREELERGRDKR